MQSGRRRDSDKSGGRGIESPSRRRLLIGGAAAIATASAGCLHSDEPSGAKGLVNDYLEALDAQQWDEVIDLFYEDSPTANAAQKDDVSNKAAIVGWGNPDDVEQSVEGLYESLRFSGDEGRTLLAANYGGETARDDVLVEINGGDDTLTVEMEIPEMETLSYVTAMVHTRFSGDAVDEFRDEVGQMEEDAKDILAREIEEDGMVNEQSYYTIQVDGEWFMWGE